MTPGTSRAHDPKTGVTRPSASTNSARRRGVLQACNDYPTRARRECVQRRRQRTRTRRHDPRVRRSAHHDPPPAERCN